MGISPSLICAFIALSISDANLVLFPEAFVLIKICFPLQKHLGYAKSIPSVTALLVNSDVNKTQNNCIDREFWEMQRMKEGLSF